MCALTPFFFNFKKSVYICVMNRFTRFGIFMKYGFKWLIITIIVFFILVALIVRLLGY